MAERKLSDSHKRVVRYCVSELMATGLEVEGLRDAAGSAMKLLQTRLDTLASELHTLQHFTNSKEEEVGRAKEDQSLLLQTAHCPPLMWLDQRNGIPRSKEGEMILALLESNAFETVEDVLEWIVKKCAKCQHESSGADLRTSVAGLEKLRRALSEEVLARYLVGWANKLNAALQSKARQLFGSAKVKAAPVKKLERVLEKINDEDRERLGFFAAADIRDLARFSVECASEAELQQSVQRLRDVDWFEVIKEKNGFHADVDVDQAYGYRDFKMLGVFRPPASSSAYKEMCDSTGKPVCQIVEVQFLLEEFLQIKKYQHVLYTVLRAPEAGDQAKPMRLSSDDSPHTSRNPRAEPLTTRETKFANTTQRIVLTIPAQPADATGSEGAAWAFADALEATYPGFELEADWVTGEVIVKKVARASAALSAGLRPGQRVLSINGHQLKPHVVTDRMAACMLMGAVQDEERSCLELEVIRGGEYSVRNVELKSKQFYGIHFGKGGEGASTFGLQLKVHETTGDVQVGSCVEKSAADETGELIEGDTVLEINNIALIAGNYTAESAQRELAEARSEERVRLKIRHAVPSGGA